MRDSAIAESIKYAEPVYPYTPHRLGVFGTSLDGQRTQPRYGATNRLVRNERYKT